MCLPRKSEKQANEHCLTHPGLHGLPVRQDASISSREEDAARVLVDLSTERVQVGFVREALDARNDLKDLDYVARLVAPLHKGALLVLLLVDSRWPRPDVLRAGVARAAVAPGAVRLKHDSVGGNGGDDLEVVLRFEAAPVDADAELGVVQDGLHVVHTAVERMDYPCPATR